MESGPIILVDDDLEDKNILVEVLKDLGVSNKFVWFGNSVDAYDYLLTTTEQPCIIFCDVNLPMQNGIEFKKKIDEHPLLRKKCIPFVFNSTSVDRSTVNEAYMQLVVQGFFQKGNSYQDVKNAVKVILDYWLLCKHPNTNY